jgi:hypothetical protein
MPRTKQTAKLSVGGIAPRRTAQTELVSTPATPAVRLIVSSDASTPLPPPPSDDKNDVRTHFWHFLSGS